MHSLALTQMLTRKTKLNELERKFAIPSVRKPPRADEARQAIIDEVEKDVNQRNGPLYQVKTERQGYYDSTVRQYLPTHR